MNGKSQILIIGVVIVCLVLVTRLFFLQIVDEEYKISAENNAYKYITIYPVRGLILDRNGNILVSNKNSYDIMVTPVDLQPFDTAALCRIFSIKKEFVREKIAGYKKNRRKIGYQSVVFLKQVSEREYGVFLEQSYKFPGFSGVSKSMRDYPYNAGANLFGYTTEVSEEFLEKNPSYRMGDYVGASGLELSYESVLKGEKGYTIMQRDVHNRILSPLAGGAYDKDAVPGKDIVTTIDGELQQYGEYLMQNKIGSVVAIEPSSGEILSLISSPGIEISKIANISKYYNQIINDPLKPMFNRAVMSAYPPGSVFKIVNGLIGLQEGVITEESRFPCRGGYYYTPTRILRCHAHRSPLDFSHAIMMSCNAYFCYVLKGILENPEYGNMDESFTKWRDYVESMGFGKKLGSDFPAELGGTLPTADTYNKIYGRGSWKSSTVISLSIGQGEIGTTPLHLANLAATIANRGYYITPHLVKSIPDSTICERYTKRNYTAIDSKYFDPVVEGMYMAVNSRPGEGGTATRAKVEGLDICGKTGTAQNPHGKDNAVFICFAPRENPKIAVAVYIENAGFGGTWAAPVASLIVEKYLTGTITRPELEKYMAETNLIP
ncbi:MAG: penicillin-binding protein 2 [Bacteroidetes bacterium]|uniref:Penicillin-binding protein 2 n=1 Tax=Candidatus Egerieousia excrementavium TaxID=2840778 RepID=A0A9D9DK66_9BACT|nr:penicillin-binding protein 2 [Candidatus Egerieousia excrementavium]